jgi:multidrug efflux system outer membrane protein
VDEKKEVAQYRRILDGPGAEPVRYDPGEPLSLQTALLLANQNNEQLAISGETYIQTLINKDRATANFLPVIALAPTYTWAERAGGGSGSAARLTTGGVNAQGGGFSGTGGSTGASSGSASSLGGISSGVTGSSTGIGTASGSGTGAAVAGGTGTVTPALRRQTGTGGTGTGGTGTGAGTGTGSIASSTAILSRVGKKVALDVPVNGQINLFNGFRDTAFYNFTIAEIQRDRALLLDLQMQVLLDTANAYYTVLSNERSVSVLRENVRTQAENVRLIRGQQAAGVAKPSDVAQAEAQEAQTRASLVSAESNVHNARTLLAFLTSAPVDNATLTDQMGVPDALPTAEEEVRIAEADRQDLAAAVAQIEAGRQAVQVAFGEYYPSINLSVNYYLSKQSIPTNNEWNLLVDAVQPLFAAGLIHADVRTALSQLRQAKLNESLTRRQIRQQVLTAYENLDANGARLKELAVAVDAAREALRVAQGLYRFGNGLFLDVLIAQDQLLSAELSLRAEEFNRRIFYLNLLRETGQLGRPPGVLATTAPSTNTVPPVIGPLTLPDRNTTAPSMEIPGMAPGTAPGIVPGLTTQPSGPTTLPTTLPAYPPLPALPPLPTQPSLTLPAGGGAGGAAAPATEPATEPVRTTPPPDVRPRLSPERPPALQPSTRPLGVGPDSVGK